MPTVELFADARGISPVEDYIRALLRSGDTTAVATFERLVDLLAEHGPALGMPHSRMIDRRERLYELRFGNHRCAYVLRDGRIALLHAWRKRSQRLDEREVSRARRFAEEL